MLDTLSGHKNLQFRFLDAYISRNKKQIEETIKDYSMQNQRPDEAKRYFKMLNLHLRLCCELYPAKVIDIVEEIV